MWRVIVVVIALALPGYASAQQPPDKAKGDLHEPLARFVAKVNWIKMEGRRKVKAVPVGVLELHWLVGIEILSIEKSAKDFDRKGEQVLLIHSPAMLFQESSQKKVIGKLYSFSIFGEVRDGIPDYQGAEVTEVRDTKKKRP